MLRPTAALGLQCCRADLLKTKGAAMLTSMPLIFFACLVMSSAVRLLVPALLLMTVLLQMWRVWQLLEVQHRYNFQPQTQSI